MPRGKVHLGFELIDGTGFGGGNQEPASGTSARFKEDEDESVQWEGRVPSIQHISRDGCLGIWLGAIHFDLALVIFAFVFRSPSKALLVFGLLVVFMVILIEDRSKIGRKLSGYICRHACSYFPVSLHVEDIDAFDPNTAYGKCY